VLDPFDVLIGNLGSIALKASSRDKDLYVTWQDCKKWFPGQSECSTSIRLTAINAVGVLQGTVQAPFIQRTFGLRNYQDPDGIVVYYGNPAVEVNKFNDAVVVYNRSGSRVFLQARYSAFMHNEPDIRPSALLQAGNFPFGDNKKPEDKPYALNLDTGGIAVDPYNDTTIWMSHGYSIRETIEITPGTVITVGRVDTAIGRVFGERRYDLQLFGRAGISITPNLLKLGSQLQVTGLASNDGDAPSPIRAGKVYLVRPEDDLLASSQGAVGRVGELRYELGEFTVGALLPGESTELSMQATLPLHLPSGQYAVELIVPPIEGDEYGEANNRAQTIIQIAGPAGRIYMPVIAQ
jgi:hypothetical protein